MPTPSDNHEFDLNYTEGDDWNYNDEFAALEELVTVRDVDSERSSYTPHDNAFFYTTDTGTWYRGDGSSWVEIDFDPADHDNTAHSLAFLSDGDDVDRQVWVSSDGTVPAGAEDDDIVLTPAE